MTDRELLQQSLDAHLYHREQTRAIDRTDAVIEALRTRLAQPALAVPAAQIGMKASTWAALSPDAQNLILEAGQRAVDKTKAQRLADAAARATMLPIPLDGSAAPAVLEDAKRYQWLRDKFTRLIIHAWPNYDHGQCPCVVREINVSKNFRATDPESTDAAIDAARKAAP